MSNFKRVTKHPQTGKYEVAAYRDDYYGSHLYGIYFESDDKTYPTDVVRDNVYDFWVEDVCAAFLKYNHLYNAPSSLADLAKFLNLVQEEYTERWKRDPETGEGATKNSKVVKKLTD